MLMRPPIIRQASLSPDSQATDNYNQVATKLKTKTKQSSLSFRNNESVGQFIRREPDSISILSSGSKGTKHKKVKQSSLGKINLGQESQDNQPFEEDNRSVNSIGSRNSQKRKPKESSLGKPRQNSFQPTRLEHPSNQYDDPTDSPKANQPLFHLPTDFMFEKPQASQKAIGSPRLVGYGRLGDQPAYPSSRQITTEQVINKDSDQDKPILKIHERSIDLKKHPVLLPYQKATVAPVERIIERVQPSSQEAPTLRTASMASGTKMVNTKMNETALRRLDVFGRMKSENSVSRLSQQKDNVSRVSNEEKPKSRSKLGELLRESRENEQKASVMSNNFHVFDSGQILVSNQIYRPISPSKATKPVEQSAAPLQAQPLFSPPTGAMKYKESVPLPTRPTVGLSMKPLQEKILASDNEYFEADESNADFSLSMSHDPKASVNFCFENERRTKGIYVASNFVKSTENKIAENYSLPKTEDELKIIQKLKENEEFIRNSGVLGLQSIDLSNPHYPEQARPQVKQQAILRLETAPKQAELKIEFGQRQKIGAQAQGPFLQFVSDEIKSQIVQLQDDPEVPNEERRRKVEKPPMIRKSKQRHTAEEPNEKKSSADERERQLYNQKQQRQEQQERKHLLGQVQDQKRKQFEQLALQEVQQQRKKQMEGRNAERKKNEQELKEKYNIEVTVQKNAKRQREAQRKDRLIEVQSSYSRDSDGSRSNSGTQRRKKQSTVKINKVAKVRLMDQGPHHQESYFEPESEDKKPEQQEYEPSQQRQSQYGKFDEGQRVDVKSKTDINFYDYSNSQRDLKPPSSKPPLSKKSSVVTSKSKSKPKESTLNIRNNSILPNKSTFSKHEETGKKISLVERALAKAYDGSEGQDNSQGSFRDSIDSKHSKNSRNSRKPKKEPSGTMMKSNQQLRSQNSSTVQIGSLREQERTIVSKNCTFINEKGKLVTQDLVIKGGKAYGVPSRIQNDDQLHISLLQRSRERRQKRSRSRSRDSKTKFNSSRAEQQFAPTICQDFYEQQRGEQIFATQSNGFRDMNFTTNALRQFIKPVEEASQQRATMNQTANPSTWKADEYYQSAVGPKKNVRSKRTMPRMERSRKKA